MFYLFIGPRLVLEASDIFLRCLGVASHFGIGPAIAPSAFRERIKATQEGQINVDTVNR